MGELKAEQVVEVGVIAVGVWCAIELSTNSESWVLGSRVTVECCEWSGHEGVEGRVTL